MNHVLIVEDDVGLQTQYRWGLDDFDKLFAEDRDIAFDVFKNNPNISVVLLDLGLPPDPDNASEGLALLSDMVSIRPHVKVIVLTGSEQEEHAQKAVALGACDYLQKGVSNEQIAFSIKRSMMMYNIERENRRLRNQAMRFGSLVGESDAIRKSTKMLTRIAATPVSTMLLGESGTGKEVFAKTIHERSGRSGEFVAINCASIPAELLESELFGHEKGSFTGAHKTKVGKIERAQGGTLFLDEIGDMPISLQAKMLRFVQEREVERVGGNSSIKVETRIICATHRDLKAMSEDGLFRADLYYRLSEFTLNIPSLKEREDDVILLAKLFMEQYQSELNTQCLGFSDDAITAMMNYNWPGNIRELQNKVKSSLLVAEGNVITSHDLNLPIDDDMLFASNWWAEDDDDEDRFSLKDVRTKAEIKAVFAAYRYFNGNISAASKALGITRPTFYAFAERFNMRVKPE